jgi:hypothetical protein
MIPLMLQHPLVYCDDTVRYVTQVGMSPRTWPSETFCDVVGCLPRFLEDVRLRFDQVEQLFVRLAG